MTAPDPTAKPIAASPAAKPATAGWQRLWPVAALLVLVAAIYLTGWHRALTLTNLYEQRTALRALIDDNLVLALVAYAALYAAVTALSLPGGLVLTIAGGFLFGWMHGAIGTVIGATIGATLLFLVVRTSFGESLAGKAGPVRRKVGGRLQARRLQLPAVPAAGAGVSVLHRQPGAGAVRRLLADLRRRHLPRHHPRHARLRLCRLWARQRVRRPGDEASKPARPPARSIARSLLIRALSSHRSC